MLIYQLISKKADVEQITREILRSGSPDILAYIYRQHPILVASIVASPEIIWVESSDEMAVWILSRITRKNYLLLASRSELDSNSVLLDHLVRSPYYSEAVARDVLIPAYFANQNASKIGVGQFESFYECLGVSISNYFQRNILKSISPELLKKVLAMYRVPR